MRDRLARRRIINLEAQVGRLNDIINTLHNAIYQSTIADPINDHQCTVCHMNLYPGFICKYNGNDLGNEGCPHGLDEG